MQYLHWLIWEPNIEDEATIISARRLEIPLARAIKHLVVISELVYLKDTILTSF